MSQTEKYQVGDLIIQEAGREFCREAKTIDVANNAEIVVGEIFEVDSGAADYKKLATDGNAVVVCLENYKNETGASVRKTVPVIYRGGNLILVKGVLSGYTVYATAASALITQFGGDTSAIIRTELGG